MNSILDRYLNRVLIYANQPEPKAEAIRKELKDHLLQKVDDLTKTGLSHEEATLEALRQHGPPKSIGYRLRDPFPWIDIRSQGTARGVIAIGPRAVGIFAFGGVAFGVIACGSVAVGLFSAGFLAVGLLFAWAFLGAGGLVMAFAAIGLVADGYWAVGVIAADGIASGIWVPYADSATSYYTSENVPPLLKSLGGSLHSTAFVFHKHLGVILTLFVSGIMALNFMIGREGKRVYPKDDWLIDG
jgi:hypothetical protein